MEAGVPKALQCTVALLDIYWLEPDQKGISPGKYFINIFIRVLCLLMDKKYILCGYIELLLLLPYFL